jgi:hypothetical protein
MDTTILNDDIAKETSTAVIVILSISNISSTIMIIF